MNIIHDAIPQQLLSHPTWCDHALCDVEQDARGEDFGRHIVTLETVTMTAAMEQPTPAEITTSVEAGVWSDDPRPRIWTRCLDGDYLLMSTEETLDDAERNLLALEQLVEIKRAAIERARTLV